MLHFRPLLLCVPQKIPGNREFGPFQNVKIAPTLGNPTDRDETVVSYEGSQDTSASMPNFIPLLTYILPGKTENTKFDGPFQLVFFSLSGPELCHMTLKRGYIFCPMRLMFSINLMKFE